jgi:hypothetical protein
MENTDQTNENQNEVINTVEENDAPQLIITENMRSYIYDTANWAKFLSIVGFIMSGLMIMAALSIGAIMGTLNAVSGGIYGALGTGALTFMFILYTLLILYPSIMLYLYATKAKQGVLYGDQLSLENALSKMKSFFKFYGIVTIVMLAIYLLAFIAGIGGALAGA